MSRQINISAIKTSIKSILEAANTTTGSPIDLSQNMDRRVQKVLKVHPGRVPIQTDYFPYVTCYTDSKIVSLETIAKDQYNAKRSSDPLIINIVGGVFEPVGFDAAIDNADENIEKLMENIEEILRFGDNHRLGGNVQWSFPEDIEYHDIPIEERNLYRTGTLSLSCRKYY